MNDGPIIQIRKSATKCASIVSTGRTAVSNDVANDPRYLTAFGSTQSEIIVPIVAENKRVVGTLDVESETKNAFSDADARQLEQYARAILPLRSECRRLALG